MADGKQIVPSPEGPENVGWLINIMKGEEPQSRAKPLIQKVSRTLRENESNKSCFNPMVVSLGPYHHGQERLMQMENYKPVAARWFVSLATHNKPPRTITDMEVQVAYEHFITEATRESCPTHCYADKFPLFKFTYNDFMIMMFLDGCFILHFIHLVVKGSDELSKTSHLNQPLILRDMFLLENQIPYSILKALMHLLPNQNNEIKQFIELVFHLERRQPRSYSNPINLFIEICSNFKKDRQITSAGSKSAYTEKESEPFHLLDFLRSKLIGTEKSPTFASPESDYWQYYLGSTMELKTAGIKLRRSKSKCLKDIRFRSGIIHGHLELPQLVVDGVTKTRLLNLIAYEMCPDGLSDHAVTSYICFLDSQIDHAEDVKELRSNDILLNRLGLDEEVVNLFNELANNLTPNYNTYSDVLRGIEKHSRSRVKARIAKWIDEFKQNHFTSPWTVTALMAAIFVISLTVLQTVYTVLGYYNRK